MDDSIWDELGQGAWQEVAPAIARIYLRGAREGSGVLPKSLEVLVDWNYVNQSAAEWLIKYKPIVDGVTETTKEAVTQAIIKWQASGQPLDALFEVLERWFSRERAEAIATTEVTRMYAEGNIAAWKSTGVVWGKVWQTAMDELVCPICAPLHGKQVSLNGGWSMDEEGKIVEGLGITAPPAHVRCRCWLLPVVDEGLVSQALREALVKGMK